MSDDALVAEGALSGLFDAVHAEEVVATGGLDRVAEDIEADRTQPSVI